MSYDKNNVFAKIIRGEIPAKKVYEDTKILAFEDINKVAPVHILIISKGDYANFDEFSLSEDLGYFFKKTGEIATMLGLENGYRIIINNGKDANQTIHHFHLHLIGKKQFKDL